MALASRLFILLVISFALAATSEATAQSLTASRTLVDIQPVSDQCQVRTCVEAAATRAGICAVQVLDNSGSMNTDGRFAAAQAGISQFVDSLDVERGDSFGLVTFSGPSLILGGGSLPNLGLPSLNRSIDPPSQDFPSAKTAVAGLGTEAVSSLTPLAAGVEAGADILAACPDGALPTMIVSTDGLPNWHDAVQCTVTPLGATDCTDAAVAAAVAAKSKGIHIVTIGIDLSAGDPSEAFAIDLLHQLATSPNDANFFNTADGLGQADIFTHLARSTASPANVRFVETLPDACWGYVAGSTTGTIATDPVIDAIGDRGVLAWNLETVADGAVAGLCYSMAYDPSCGSSPASLVVQENGEARWQRTDATESSADFGSQTIDAIKECQIVIPVELVAFDAVSSGREVTLRWETASEVDNAGFSIERSGGGNTFEEVAFVTGRGNSVVISTYQFVDALTAPGLYRYRLRQIDFDGTFNFSPTVEIHVEVPDSYFMSAIYPNPMRDHASFELAVARTQRVRIELIDTIGRSVMTVLDARVQVGSTRNVTLNASEIPSGIYVIRAVGEYFSTTKLASITR